jgi:hypothetical protein
MPTEDTERVLPQTTTQNSSIVIVGRPTGCRNQLFTSELSCFIGAGIFGLSTALHLVENGYTNVSLFDRQDLENADYLPFNGADSASSGRNNTLLEGNDREIIVKYSSSSQCLLLVFVLS